MEGRGWTPCNASKDSLLRKHMRISSGQSVVVIERVEKEAVVRNKNKSRAQDARSAGRSEAIPHEA